jgi:hypothetical protein
MRTLSLNTLLVTTFFFGAALVACGSKSSSTSGTDTTTSAETADGNEAEASSAQVSRMEEAIFSPVSATDPAAAASNIASANWWPAGCVTRQKDATNPTVVHIHLNDCTGPFGLVHHTGDITVTFSKNASGGLHAQAASSNMTVNGKPVTYSRDADIVVSGTTRTVTSTGAWTRVNAKGETVSHTGSYTTDIDTVAKCRTTNGTATTMVGSREVDSTVKDYKICRKADGTEGCPDGTVTHTHAATGRTLTVTFDGSAQATITGPKGGSIEVNLVCIP